MKKLICFLLITPMLCCCDKIFDLNIKSIGEHYDGPSPGYLDYMPEHTQVGANTFGCYINDTLFAVRGYYQRPGHKPNFYGWWMDKVNGFWGVAEDKSKEKLMHLDIDLSENRYMYFAFKELNKGKNRIKIYYRFSNSAIYSGETESAFIDILKLDIDKQILCGSFDSIPIRLSDGLDTLNIIITKGYFDIKYGIDKF